MKKYSFIIKQSVSNKLYNNRFISDKRGVQKLFGSNEYE